MRTFRTTGMLLSLPLLTAGTLALARPTASAHDDAPHHTAVTVRVGESIQKALDAAAPGAHVWVESGAYWENLVIAKPVQLHGIDVVLLRPAQPADGPCTFEDTAPAICVFDTGDPSSDTAPPRLAGVSIYGLRIATASGDGITAINTTGLDVHDTIIEKNDGAGIVLVDSVGAIIHHNEIGTNQGPGIVLTESVDSGTQIIDNLSYNNAAGVLVINATGADINRNRLHGNCIGVAVADHSTTGEAGHVGINHNLIWDNNSPVCVDSDRSGIGILLSGAVEVSANHNTINGHQGAGPVGGSGVAIINSTGADGGVPSKVVVNHNHLTANGSDLTWDGTGSDINLTGNHCRTSNPEGQCTPLVDHDDDVH